MHVLSLQNGLQFYFSLMEWYFLLMMKRLTKFGFKHFAKYWGVYGDTSESYLYLNETSYFFELILSMLLLLKYSQVFELLLTPVNMQHLDKESKSTLLFYSFLESRINSSHICCITLAHHAAVPY